MAPETKRYGATMLSENLISDTETAAAFLTLMGNEKRLAIMSHLVDDELTVGTIAEKVDLSQSALSQHLAKLRAFGLVQTRRDRQMIYYSCRSEAVRQLLATLGAIFSASSEPKQPTRVNNNTR